MRGKKDGVSIDKVKEMLKKGTTLSELTNLLLNKKKHRESVPFSYTAEEKEAVVRALTPVKKKQPFFQLPQRLLLLRKQKQPVFQLPQKHQKKLHWLRKKKYPVFQLVQFKISLVQEGSHLIKCKS